MTTGGWIFMILAWGVIIFTVAYTYGRIISDGDDPADEQDYRIVE